MSARSLLESALKDNNLPVELADLIDLYNEGARKHGKDTYLSPSNISMQHKKCHDSLFHHLAESYCNARVDKESGLDPLLHLIGRASQLYVRIKRGIKDA